MLPEERDRLAKAAKENQYISIAINEDGAHFRGCTVPWERTASAYNMKLPDVSLAALDLQDASIMEDLGKCRVIGCYIFTPLENYQFLYGFTQLRDLFLLKGKNIRDLSFVKNMPWLYLFFLEDATLSDLAPLVRPDDEDKCLPGKCFGFCRCRVEDTSALVESDMILSELLVWPSEGDTRDRWRPARRPGVFRFFEQ